MKQKRTHRSPLPILLAIGGGLLLVVAVILMATQNAAPAQTPVPAQEESYPEIARVNLSDAKTALDEGSAVFIDVRAAEAYQAGHVAGSINIPLAELETRLGELDKARWIITYCT